MNIGDEVELSIVGMVNSRHRARLESIDPSGHGRFRIMDDAEWPLLKAGDYILHWQVPGGGSAHD
jgi:hypothetical protein